MRASCSWRLAAVSGTRRRVLVSGTRAGTAGGGIDGGVGGGVRRAAAWAAVSDTRRRGRRCQARGGTRTLVSDNGATWAADTGR
ncbi:MAG: hypothetical protein LBK25_06845, partial [Treponema sp.]|nr:hypothetical protein [Treponema sp.]